MKELFLPPEEKKALDAGFSAAFGRMPERYFSAPGRTEIGGNHTDHQRGRVLAAAVDLDMRAAVGRNDTGVIRILSQGYPMSVVDTRDLTPKPEEQGSTTALIRGMAACFVQRGCPVEGFDAYLESTVLPGSGLSSSAAYEVLVGTVLNALFSGGFSAPEIARMGQQAENVYFGKPCGLMDQMASAVGGMVTIDFLDPNAPVIQPVEFDFSACGHALCIIDSRASHADLTEEYAAITRELGAISAFFGKDVLRQVEEDAFYDALPQLRRHCGDRAVLRAIHFYRDNARVPMQVAALQAGDFEAFLRLVSESGRSSYMYLQNVLPTGAVRDQAMGIALALCQRYLEDRGAFRVHGGGFAGTVQAFVPFDLLEGFRAGIDGALGPGACHVLSIRPQGGVEMTVSSR